ncbi:hypothetical protein DJ69_11205 [Halorubrum persicum]|uniref:Uncharacterized protein n=1 Tax=Halorubrum persicum TaxID=1383844 RepID=A0A2G1WHQ7_9EURY|nr:hypothetical protein DJ69_11205 [Halorubrum persicum]
MVSTIGRWERDRLDICGCHHIGTNRIIQRLSPMIVRREQIICSRKRADEMIGGAAECNME